MVGNMKIKKIISKCNYIGHTINKNGVCKLKLLFISDELGKIVQVLSMINDDINLVFKYNDDKGSEVKCKIGKVIFNSFSVDKDSKVKLILEGINDDLDLNYNLVEKNLEVLLLVK